MPTAIIRTPDSLPALMQRLRDRKFPLTVSWATGAPRTGAQNRLAQRWYTDISLQLGDQTHEEVRAMCKLQFGVPILKRQDEAFAASFAQVFDGLPYAVRLEAMEAMDLPVTRMMKTPQMTEYMDTMQRHWLRQGIRLTDPEALRYEEEFGA